MSADFDEMFGDEPAPKPKRVGRPTKEQAAIRRALGIPVQKKAPKKPASTKALFEGDPDHDALGPGEVPDVSAFHRPVTRTFLSTVLGVEPRRLVKRLAKCPPVTTGLRGEPRYDFKEAIAYCVEPKLDVEQWIKTKNAMDLPPAFSKAYWDAMRSRQMVMSRAGDLWTTADVMELMGRTAITIKDTVNLWTENLPGHGSLTQEQYDFFRRETTELLNEVYARLVKMAGQTETRASVKEFDDVGKAALSED